MIVCLVTSCQTPREAVPPVDPALGKSIPNYLAEEIGIAGFGGEIFCAIEYLDPPQSDDGEIYLWALCLEFYREEGRLLEGSGISLPVALETQSVGGQFNIVSHRVPGDGSRYGPDVREIFPRGTWEQILPKTDEELNWYNLRANELQTEVRIQANDQFQTEEWPPE